MTLSTHHQALAQKHEDVEAQLAQSLKHPSTTDAEITSLKRRKLVLKDKMTRVEKDMQQS